MTIAVRQSATATFGGQLFCAPQLTGVLSLSGLICVITHQDFGGTNPNFTVVDSVGSTAYNSDVYRTGGGGVCQVEIASNYAVSAGTHTCTVTATSGIGSNSFGAATLIEVTGLGGSLDQTAANNGNNNTPSSGVTGTLAGLNEIAIVGMVASSAVPSGTYPPTGGPGVYTSVYSSPSSTFADVDYQILATSAAAVSASWGTLSAGLQWVGAIATYKPTSALIYQPFSPTQVFVNDQVIQF